MSGGRPPRKSSTPTSRAKRHIIALGGGGFGAGDLLLERYILAQAAADRPLVGFIPTATGDDDAYLIRFYTA